MKCGLKTYFAILSTMPLRTSWRRSLACSWLGGGINGSIRRFFSGNTKFTIFIKQKNKISLSVIIFFFLKKLKELCFSSTFWKFLNKEFIKLGEKTKYCGNSKIFAFKKSFFRN